MSSASYFPYAAADWASQDMADWLPWIRSPDAEINQFRNRFSHHHPSERIPLGLHYLRPSNQCERLDVAPLPPGDLVPQAEIYRAEAALRQRGLDVRETASR